MAIGTTAAILGSAAISAGASALGASKNSKAINRATEAQTDSNAQSLALQREIYGQNRQTLNPFITRGNAAGNQLNALLGLGGGQPAQQTQAQQTQAQPNALSQFNPQGPIPVGGVGAPYGLGDFAGTGYAQPGIYNDFQGDLTGAPNALQSYYKSLPAAQGSVVQPTTEDQILDQGQTPKQAAEDAFATFRDNTGYQFRVNEATDAVTSFYGGNRLLQSGAAQEALATQIGNEADNTFLNYAGLLSQQQGPGLQAAGAQAGVGVNYANSVTGINQANANALSNAAVAKANNSNALIAGIGNAAGSVLGGLAYRPLGK